MDLIGPAAVVAYDADGLDKVVLQGPGVELAVVPGVDGGEEFLFGFRLVREPRHEYSAVRAGHAPPCGRPESGVGSLDGLFYAICAGGVNDRDLLLRAGPALAARKEQPEAQKVWREHAAMEALQGYLRRVDGSYGLAAGWHKLVVDEKTGRLGPGLAVGSGKLHGLRESHG